MTKAVYGSLHITFAFLLLFTVCAVFAFKANAATGQCYAVGKTWQQAKDNYRDTCKWGYKDCDPIDGKADNNFSKPYVCAKGRNVTSATMAEARKLFNAAPVSTPAQGQCYATGKNVNEAKIKFAQKCGSTANRDCDPINGGRNDFSKPYVCAAGNVSSATLALARAESPASEGAQSIEEPKTVPEILEDAQKELEDAQTQIEQQKEEAEEEAPIQNAGCTGSLKYSQPNFSGYKVIDLNNTGQTSFRFGSGDKVLFLGANNKTYSHLRVEGGKHVAIIGGKYAPGKNTVRSGGKSNITGTLYFKNMTGGGSIYIEGVHVDNKDSFGSDGIVLNAGNDGGFVDVTIQNSRVENIDGCQPCSHGDVIQTQGRVSSLKMYNFTGTSGYQGFFLPYQDKSYGGKLRGKVEFEKVNLGALRTANNDHTTHLFWFDTNGKQQISLKNVYSDTRGAQRGHKNVVPGSASGSVQSGRPPGGDFVEANEVGKQCRPD